MIQIDQHIQDQIWAEKRAGDLRTLTLLVNDPVQPQPASVQAMLKSGDLAGVVNAIYGASHGWHDAKGLISNGELMSLQEILNLASECANEFVKIDRQSQQSFFTIFAGLLEALNTLQDAAPGSNPQARIDLKTWRIYVTFENELPTVIYALNSDGTIGGFSIQNTAGE